MRILTINFTFLLLVFYSISIAQVNKNYLITQTSFGKIQKNTNYRDLEKLYKKSNIKDQVYIGAEGMDSSIVTKIYPGTPKEILIFWEETLFHKKISSVESSQPNAPYYTKDNLKIGTNLRKLLKVNGKRINFYGFGWDYGGTISSFNKGKIEKSNIRFQLDIRPEFSEKLSGDVEFNTEIPSVKENVDQIYISIIRLIFK